MSDANNQYTVGEDMTKKTVKPYSKYTGTEEARLEHMLLAGLQDGLIFADGEGRIVWLNDHAGKLLNLNPDQALGQLLSSVYANVYTQGHTGIAEVIEHLYNDPYSRNQTTIPDEVIVEQAAFVMRTRLSPVFSDSGEFLGVHIRMQDISAQVEAERAKSEFVSNISHELRRPLTAIKGYSDLLLFSGIGPLNPQQEHFMRIMQENADRLVALANDLLDISHIESGRIQLDYRIVQIDKVVRDVAKSMQAECERRGVHLSLQIEPDLWPVWGDRARLVQATQNLIRHAIQATPEGDQVTIGVSCSDKAVRVDIRDGGPAIPPEEQGKLFQRFYRINNPAVADRAGTGLGLPIAKQIIELHGGGMLVDSKSGEGSTFTYVLPRQSGAAEKAAALHGPDQRTTVLVVEDERDIAELIALQLRSEGFEVLTTAMGEQALTWARERPIDLITLDMMLPDITGMEVLRRLKSDEATADIPVIVVSVIQPKITGTAWGAAEHISKPFALDKLMDSVRRTLGNARRGRLTPVTVVDQEGAESL